MILRAKYLITGDGRTCLQDQAVYLDKEGKIGWIGDAAEAAGRYPEEMVKDYGEATILPGLFDMHVHFGYYYSQPDLFNYDDYMLAYYALNEAHRALRRGITTIRDVSSPSGLLKQLRLAGEKGFVTVPRIIHTDTGMCMTGGHGHDDGCEQQLRFARAAFHERTTWALVPAAGVYASAMLSVTNVRPSEAISTRSNAASPSAAAARHRSRAPSSPSTKQAVDSASHCAPSAPTTLAEARSDAAG